MVIWVSLDLEKCKVKNNFYVFWCFKIYCVVFLESFEDAAFALKVNELSGPVKSDSGIHLIYRVA